MYDHYGAQVRRQLDELRQQLSAGRATIDGLQREALKGAARLRTAETELAEARSWARHGYEIGQRHCGWTDHGVAPRWLTEGWPPQIDTCQHLTELAIAEARIAALRALAESWEREHPRFGIGAQVLAALDGPPDTSAVIPLPQPTTEEPYWRRPHTSPTPEATP